MCTVGVFSGAGAGEETGADVRRRGCVRAREQAWAVGERFRLARRRFRQFRRPLAGGGPTELRRADLAGAGAPPEPGRASAGLRFDANQSPVDPGRRAMAGSLNAERRVGAALAADA